MGAACDRCQQAAAELAKANAELDTLRAQLREMVKLAELQAGDLERYRKVVQEQAQPNRPERVPDSQLQLALERILSAITDAPTKSALEANAKESTDRESKKRSTAPHGRRNLELTGLPVEEHRIVPDEVLACGGEGWERVDEETSDRPTGRRRARSSLRRSTGAIRSRSSTSTSARLSIRHGSARRLLRWRPHRFPSDSPQPSPTICVPTCVTTHHQRSRSEMSDDQRLKEKLRAIEALFAGTTSEGERDAAARARQRILERLAAVMAETPVEWQFTVDRYQRQLLIALARRYDLKPYRYQRQRYSTLIIRAPERFLKETFLPEYDRMVEVLGTHLAELTQRVVADALNGDLSEPPEQPQLQMEAILGKTT